MPQLHESGISIEEYRKFISAVLILLILRLPPTSVKWEVNVLFILMKIGKRLPNTLLKMEMKVLTKGFLNSSPIWMNVRYKIRTFKKPYLAKWKEESKRENPKAISVLPVKNRGRPPLMLELDYKLIKILWAIRSKGGMVNTHVIHATSNVLFKSNPALIQHFLSFEMSWSWV